MPDRHGVLRIVRVQKLAPSMAQCLFGGGTTIVIPTVIPVLHQAIWSSCPYELRHRFGQHAPVLLAGFERSLERRVRLESRSRCTPHHYLTCFITYGHSAA